MLLPRTLPEVREAQRARAWGYLGFFAGLRSMADIANVLTILETYGFGHVSVVGVLVDGAVLTCQTNAILVKEKAYGDRLLHN